MTLKLADARRIADTVLEQAAKQGTTKVSIVLTDPGGHVRLAMRADGQGIFGVETATAKAISALGFNRATLALTPLFSDQATAAINGATKGRFAPLGGGVVITNSSGEIVGAAGLSGGLPETDHAIVVAAIEACGFSSLP